MLFEHDQEYMIGGISNNIKTKSTTQKWIHEEDTE